MRSTKVLGRFGTVVSILCFAAGLTHARELTFEQRVAAQAAIDRVYYSHQDGATRPFEEAVSRAILERKVQTYLRQSVALDQVWKTPVTAEALQREMDRITRGTRFPDRLAEISAALGGDEFLIQECLARPALVDRLARNFFAFDSTIHAGARAEAETALAALRASAAIQPGEHLFHSKVVLHRSRPTEPGDLFDPSGASRIAAASDSGSTIELDPEEFDRRRATLPSWPGRVGEIEERKAAFLIPVLLSSADDRLLVETWSVPKRSWDEWLQEKQPEFDRKFDALNPSPDPHAVDTMAGGSPVLSGVLSSSQKSHGLPFGASAAAIDPACLADDRWDAGALDDMPDGRSYHTAVWTGSLMIVWGGYNSPTLYKTGNRYDPLLDTWSPVSTTNAPEGRTGHTAVWTGTVMIIWGGDVGTGFQSYTSTGGRYDPITDQWTATLPNSGIMPRRNHSAVWTGSQMIIWGGDGGVNHTTLNEGSRYDPLTDAWLGVTTVSAPSGRNSHTAVWTGSRMVIWGGKTDNGKTDTGGQYDPVTNTWTATATTGALSPRTGHKAVWSGSEMIVWGGGDYQDNTGGRYNPSTNSWVAMSTSNAPQARLNHSLVWTGTRLVVWGGAPDSGGFGLNTGGVYDPELNHWTQTSTTGAPRGRDHHSAIWSGTHMIVWGGTILSTYGGVFPNSGGRYDPASNSWTPTSVGGAPEQRARHTAVWTGNEMIVWGGEFDTGQSLNTGGRYDPLLDSWRNVTTTSAPAALLAQHTAVWTGQRMIVWGYSGGGRYDPIADSWAPITTTGAPMGRFNHTAVWTGSDMIIWGGEQPVPDPPCYYQAVGTGGRYDPVLNTWSPITAAGAPSPRALQTATWTGSEMIVWGGIGDFRNNGSNNCIATEFSTGGRYDPVLGVWTPTTTTNAPFPRRGHTAVWSGSDVIVWGNGTTGGRYHPSTDSWTPTSTVNAPQSRIGHSAVWTGERMLIWGGSASTTDLNTGGRYDPVLDQWSNTSTTGAPRARDYHSAVWTGDVMIVWGGSQLNSGSRYGVGKADSDGDSIADVCDPCPGDPLNDPDGDHVCNSSDNCTSVANPHQADADGDGHGNLCDNCPVILNANQADADGDGQGDACDCRSLDPTVRQPAEVMGLTATRSGSWTTVLEWAPTAAANAYSITRGDLSSLSPSDYGACLTEGLTGTSYLDATVPAPGEGFFYLIQGQSFTCGMGSLGQASSEQPRTNSNSLACAGAPHVQATLPANLPGNVSFRVIDTERAPGHQAINSATIDKLFVRSLPSP